jgi:hypothetical protein
MSITCGRATPISTAAGQAVHAPGARLRDMPHDHVRVSHLIQVTPS